MVVLRPDPVVEDERAKALLFALIANDDHGAFEFAELLRRWFNRDTQGLASFLEWLDARGLEIRKKK